MAEIKARNLSGWAAFWVMLLSPVVVLAEILAMLLFIFGMIAAVTSPIWGLALLVKWVAS